jgi:CheY-like chemotaxis protein
MASILLVDDNVEFRNILSLALSGAGHTVTLAANGRQALQLFSRISCDLIISDIVMPEKDGLEMLLQLRATKPSFPIILMSGDSPENAELYLKVAEQLGATQVLRKPFKAAALLAAVASIKQ